jgi:glutamate-5-semialdehyde dehydrogenase
MTATDTNSDLVSYAKQLASNARAAGNRLMTVSGANRRNALHSVAQRLLDASAELIAANAKDLEAGKAAGLSTAMLDRLKIDDKAVKKMAASVQQIADQTDPVGQVIEGSVRPNGLRLQKVRVPIGVVLIIYESRPNVTSDAAALCIKSGNACILRGGKEAMHSNAAIAKIVAAGLKQAGLDEHAVQLVDTPDRAVVTHLLKLESEIDVVIPRGGESLIRAVVEQSHIPVIKHYTGNCHVYVDQFADADMAVNICLNAKAQRPGVCNAAESLLFHKETVHTGLLKRVCEALSKAGVEIRGDKVVHATYPVAKKATEADWGAEYLELIVAVKVVDSLEEAVQHINKYGSKHTDAIVTNDIAAADAFVQQVDTANAFVNCSTRFSDGGEYGLGAEIGISTDKLHARGPMGAADLTTYKWVAYGNGQVRG